MAIKHSELKEMNDLLDKGATIAQIAKKYPAYDYWEIYWRVNDNSFLGKKRSITNRLKKLARTKNAASRKAIAKETRQLVDELYRSLKINSKKLIEIDRVLRK